VLVSYNPLYPPRFFIGSDLENVSIWGKVVEIKRSY